jgi:hypothetical protein
VFSTQVSEALRVLTGIVRLQKGPEDLPFSPLLLLLIVVSSAPDAGPSCCCPEKAWPVAAAHRHRVAVTSSGTAWRRRQA